MARKLAQAEWQVYFDRLSEHLAGMRAEVEINALHLGSQIETEWRLLLGVSYDPHDDLIDVAMEDLDHAVSKPRKLYVEDASGTLECLEIVDEANVHHLVKFREPMLLTRIH